MDNTSPEKKKRKELLQSFAVIKKNVPYSWSGGGNIVTIPTSRPWTCRCSEVPSAPRQVWVVVLALTS